MEKSARVDRMKCVASLPAFQLHLKSNSSVTFGDEQVQIRNLLVSTQVTIQRKRGFVSVEKGFNGLLTRLSTFKIQ
jgi:hypothetical protein